tara:strand:- start:321 stop:1136 length:816 start_codon:yes stop_codon:yes gene_type:complete
MSIYFDKYQPKATWGKHWHPTVQVLIFGAGSECTIQWEDNGHWREQRIRGRHVWVIGAGVSYKLEWHREALRLVLYLEPAFAEESAGLVIRSTVLFSPELIAKCDTKVAQLLNDIDVLDQPATRPDFIHIESLGSLITVRLFKAWRCLTEGRKGGAEGLGRHTMSKLDALITERLDTKLLLTDMAREVGMSRSNLARLFRRRMGLSLGQYLIGRRISKAKEMLALDEHRIGEIAVSVGFANQGHFDDLFKKWVGVTPTEYRQSLRQLRQIP